MVGGGRLRPAYHRDGQSTETQDSVSLERSEKHLIPGQKGSQ